MFGALKRIRGLPPAGRPVVARPEMGLGFLLVALTLGVYARAVRFGFLVFDDPKYVTDNFHVLGGLSLRGIRWACCSIHDSNWIPLTWISLMLDTTVYGRWAGGFHATNILLHAANVLLVFLLFTRATGRTWPSACVAALFAVHPAHVESVAWIAERKDVLSMFFGLLSLCAYVRFAEQRRYAWLAAAFICFLCSLASKQTFVTLPFVFLLLDFWPLGRFADGPRPARGDASAADRRCRLAFLFAEKIPFFAASAAFCAVALAAQSHGHSVRSLAEVSLASRVLNAVVAVGLYLDKALVPAGLAFFYPHPGTAIRFADVALAGGELAGISMVALVTVRRWPFLFVGWLWFLGTLVPMIGLVQVGVQQMADRYTYLPYLGVHVAVVWLAAAMASGPIACRRVLPAIACGMVALFAGLSFVQLGYWRDGSTLMRHALAVTGENPFGCSLLGYALEGESRVDEALAQDERAVALAPQDPLSHANLGLALYHLRQFQAAADQYRAAVEIDDRDPDTHTGLGLALCGERDYLAGRRELCRAVELDPNSETACAALALLCRALGESDPAIAYAERALKLDDSPLSSQRLLAIKLVDQGRWDEAIDRLRQVVAVAPDFEDARADLERVQALKCGRTARADNESTLR